MAAANGFRDEPSKPPTPPSATWRSSSTSFGPVARESGLEVGDRLLKARLEGGLRLPAEDGSSPHQVGTALAGIVFRDRPKDDLTPAAAEIANPLGQLEHGDLVGGPEIDRVAVVGVEQPD